jgi:hypothetical protein
MSLIPRDQIVERLVVAVREVAAEKPDLVYSAPYGGCAYVADGQPSCIVGHAAWRLGLIDGSLESDDGINSSGVTTLLRHLGVLPNNDLDYGEPGYAREFLDAVQEKQDEGVPWGDAVEIADERAGTWTA